MGKKKDIRILDEWMASTGEHTLLCVPCEVNEAQSYSTPAIVVLRGFSLCREHLEVWHTFGIHDIPSTN